MDKRFTPAFYLSPDHDCAYRPQETARTLFADPAFPMNPDSYQELIDQGFRRSGGHVYRPYCPRCQACVSLRVPARDFRPRRSQRRCWKKNRPVLDVRIRPAGFDEEHFELYQRYTDGRHPEGGMRDATPKVYLDFLAGPWTKTLFCEFRLKRRLAAVAVTDLLPRGLSAVYTFFDPELKSLSLGVFAVLWQIERARSLGLPWLYLGYWIEDCRKMHYKEEYRPVEAWTGSGWKRFGVGAPIVIPDPDCTNPAAHPAGTPAEITR